MSSGKHPSAEVSLEQKCLQGNVFQAHDLQAKIPEIVDWKQAKKMSYHSLENNIIQSKARQSTLPGIEKLKISISTYLHSFVF
jgi:hypothetical protein